MVDGVGYRSAYLKWSSPQDQPSLVSTPRSPAGSGQSRPAYSAPSVIVSVSQAARILREGAKLGAETYTAADAVAAYQAAVQTDTLDDLGPVAIKDSSANVQAVLDALGEMAADKKVALVSFTDKSGSLTIDRSQVSGRLDDAATTDGVISLLQKIGSKYTLKATNATVSDALSIKGPNKQATLALEVTDTADAVSGQLEQIGGLVKKKTISAIYLSDEGSPLTISAKDLKKANDALSAVKSDYSIALTDVTVKDLAAAKANAKVSEIFVKDSAANILKSAVAIKANEKVASIEFNDKKELKFTIDEMMTLKGLGNVQEPSVGYVIADKALTVIAHIRYDINDIISGAKTVSITDKKPANITLDDAKTLRSISNLQKGAKYNLVESLTSVAANKSADDESARDGAEEVIVAPTYTIAEVNSLLKLKKLKRSVDLSITDTAANVIAEAAKRNGILSRGLTVTVRDTAANVAANIDALQALAKDDRITVIELTDNQLEFLNIPSYSLGNYGDLIGKITSRFSFDPTDTTPPLAPTLVGPSAITNNKRPVFMGNSEANSTIYLFNGSAQIGTAVTNSAGSWSYTPTLDLADGPYSITAKSEDAAGNVSSASAAIDFFLISSFPTVSISDAQSVTEGSNGFKEVRYTVTLDKQIPYFGSVAWKLSGAGLYRVDAGDFSDASLPSGTLTFNPGDLAAEISFRIQSDTDLEEDEGYKILLEEPTFGLQLNYSKMLVDGYIVNDDLNPSTQFYWDPANGGNGNVYEFNNPSVPFFDALAAPKTKTLAGTSGHLLTITSLAEHSFVVSRPTFDAIGYWLAASDSQIEGQWKWIDGPESGEIFWNSGPIAGRYHNWDLNPIAGYYPPQPDGGTQQNYAILGGNFRSLYWGISTPLKWLDGRFSDNQFSYIIEYEAPDLDF